MEIRDKKLYEKVRGTATFEMYCRERWDFSRQRAYQLIDAIAVKNNLSTCVDITVTEYQLRPLTKIPTEQQKEVWQKAPEGVVYLSIDGRFIWEMARIIAFY